MTQQKHGTTTSTQVQELEDIEKVITQAIKKIGGQNENDLCKYLPTEAGGHMHHFTLRKMKLKRPFDLARLIDEFIIQPSKPDTIAPRPRAARGSRKRKDQITFTKAQLEKLLHVAHVTGNKEMLSMLAPKKSLATCKRDLIHSIRQGIVDHSLWSSYVEAASGYAQISSEGMKELADINAFQKNEF